MDYGLLSAHAGPRSLWDTFPRSPPPLLPGDVHLYRASLDPSEADLRDLGELLSHEERCRVARIRVPTERARRTAARGILRLLLSRYLNGEARALEIRAGEHGKPLLVGEAACTGLHFNLSHSEGRALYGFTRSGPIGVDLERVRALPEIEALSRVLFTEREHGVFANLDPTLRTWAFFRGWTRKEAILKATGAGIGRGLSHLEVCFGTDPTTSIAGGQDLSQRTGEWAVREVALERGYVAAMAVRAGDGRGRDRPGSVIQLDLESGDERGPVRWLLDNRAAPELLGKDVEIRQGRQKDEGTPQSPESLRDGRDQCGPER